MTAKAAADALLRYDLELADKVRDLFADHANAPLELNKRKADLIREITDSWTVALAAEAAMVPKKAVLDAFARYHLQTTSRFASRILEARGNG